MSRPIKLLGRGGSAPPRRHDTIHALFAVFFRLIAALRVAPIGRQQSPLADIGGAGSAHRLKLVAIGRKVQLMSSSNGADTDGDPS